MRRAVAAFVLASLLAACLPHGSSLPSSASPSPTTPVTATLLARPLKLPALQSGSVCPVTPVASRDVGIGNPRGRGPFYLGGGVPHGNFPWNKTVWELVDGTHGPIVFRGGRLDSDGSLRFGGSPADRSESGTTLTSGGGVTTTFYERMLGEGDAGTLYLYPATAGCYGLQIDGPSFEDVIVITAS